MILIAPVAQLDRACGYEPQGREFESLRARQSLSNNTDYINRSTCFDARSPSSQAIDQSCLPFNSKLRSLIIIN